MQSLGNAIGTHLQRRVAGSYQVGAIMFSNQHGFLCQSPGTDEVLQRMEEV